MYNLVILIYISVSCVSGSEADRIIQTHLLSDFETYRADFLRFAQKNGQAFSIKLNFGVIKLPKKLHQIVIRNLELKYRTIQNIYFIRFSQENFRLEIHETFFRCNTNSNIISVPFIAH